MNVEEFRQELLRISVCTQELLRKFVVPACQRFEFTPQQLFLLGSLYQKNDQMPRELSSQIGINPGNFASVSKKLETSALICRTRSKADKRMSIIHLTEKGQELLQAMEDDMTRQYGSLFEKVPDETFHKMRDGFEAFIDLALHI